MVVYLLYMLLVPAVIFLGVVLWRAGNPPGLGYVAFIGAGAALLFVLVIDTEWYKKIPPLTAAGQLYAIGQRLDQVQSFQGVLAGALGIPTPTPGNQLVNAPGGNR